MQGRVRHNKVTGMGNKWLCCGARTDDDKYNKGAVPSHAVRYAQHVTPAQMTLTTAAGQELEKPSRMRGYSSFSITQDLAASDATAYGKESLPPMGPNAEASGSSNASMHVRKCYLQLCQAGFLSLQHNGLNRRSPIS